MSDGARYPIEAVRSLMSAREGQSLLSNGCLVVGFASRFQWLSKTIVAAQPNVILANLEPLPFAAPLHLQLDPSHLRLSA